MHFSYELGSPLRSTEKKSNNEISKNFNSTLRKNSAITDKNKTIINRSSSSNSSIWISLEISNLLIMSNQHRFYRSQHINKKKIEKFLSI